MVIKLRSAVYDSADDTVTLIPTKPFALTKGVELQIDGQPPSGLRDGSGRFIDGDHDGTAGGNAIVVITRGGASIEARTSAAADVQAGGIMVISSPDGSNSPWRNIRPDRFRWTRKEMQ